MFFELLNILETFFHNFNITKIGSGALPGLMLDLGLLKCSSLVGPYPNTFPNPAGQS